MVQIPDSIIALDVGDKRVGVAITTLIARLPNPLTVLDRDDSFVEKLRDIILENSVVQIVVGLPRGLNGQHTAQTTKVEGFTTELRQLIKLPIHFQDEALTSKKAEAELIARRKDYKLGDIDALAATYILDDFFTEQENV